MSSFFFLTGIEKNSHKAQAIHLGKLRENSALKDGRPFEQVTPIL